nr:hypothetical protein B0A51_02915 [Rachicladosporium sp. CCFEE 5018]
MASLLALPFELRDHILFYALPNPTPIPIPFTPPPPITQVCQLLRQGALLLWLSHPACSYPCTTRTDVRASKQHLTNLPWDVLAELRVLHLTATATVPFGHMAMRRSLTLTLFLSHPSLDSLPWTLNESLTASLVVPTYGLGCHVGTAGIVDADVKVAKESGWLVERRERLEKRLKWVVRAMEGRSWDAEALGEVMEAFWGVCAGGR